MHGQPMAIDLAIALSEAHPHVKFLPILHRPTQTFQAMTKGYGIARRDASSLVAVLALGTHSSETNTTINTRNAASLFIVGPASIPTVYANRLLETEQP